ncbi:MAG: MATE family efflux transporter [Anaeroplasmataceae bacterium]|nr:MATE family efflux transporter [Anaeroplasmataceae bacterium]
MEKKNLMTYIIKMSLPPAISMIIQSLYNLVDSMYVTKFDPKAMEAISIVYPIQNIILALSVGIGVGMNACIAMKLGQNKHKEAESAATLGLFLSFVHYIIVLILGLSLSKIFIQSFTKENIVIEYGLTYINLIIIFSFTTIFQIAMEKILQADGKMTLPMFSLLTGVVINLILDPILIFACHLGVLGAALATVIAQVTSTLVMLAFIISKKNRVRIHLKDFKIQKDNLLSIYRVGIPSFFMNAIPSFMVTFMNYILVGLNEVAVTTFGLYYKLQYFVYMGVSGIAQGTMPLMSYAYGANDNKKLKLLLKNALYISIGIGAIATLIFLSIPNLLMRIFYDDLSLISQTNTFLRLASIGFIFGCINYLMASYFQSIQKGLLSLILSLLRQIILLLPIAYILSLFLSENGIYLAISLAEIISSVCIVFMIIPMNKKKNLFQIQ